MLRPTINVIDYFVLCWLASSTRFSVRVFHLLVPMFLVSPLLLTAVREPTSVEVAVATLWKPDEVHTY